MSSKRDEARAARLEAELRANLKKRKEQAKVRARASVPEDSGGKVAPPVRNEGKDET